MELATATLNIVKHKPVLPKEVIDLLQVKPGGVYADCTIGLGGHSEAILESLAGTGTLIGLDRDHDALVMAEERLKSHSNFRLLNENFKNLPLVVQRLGLEGLDGCLVDLGVSSLQFDSPDRGFSFRQEGPLDMRMDRRESVRASQLLNQLSESRLTEIFREYGEEKSARRIAAEIVKVRRTSPLHTTSELADLVERVKGRRPGSRIHSATQVFQALRIEVNQELQGLDQFLGETINLLRKGGRLVVISFHSLEDRIVKRVFRQMAGRCTCFRPPHLCACPRVRLVEVLTPRPLGPTPEEIEENPRARSAKLRAVERLGAQENTETGGPSGRTY